MSNDIDDDERKAMIVGRAMLSEAAANPTFRAKLAKLLDKHVTGTPDRAALGLDGVIQGGHRKTGD